jgi:DNA/RNA-binding domain of Phe-tRNA-synthetase-like protein
MPYELLISDQWKALYPGAAAGVLAMASAGGSPERGFAALAEHLEADLRAQFAGFDRPALTALPVLQAYKAYYKRFDKTYHVLLQLESVALKGRPLPRAAPLVQAMFMAELKNQLLTAGHDLEALQVGPAIAGRWRGLRLDVASGRERYTTLGGEAQDLKPGDMFISDEGGVISSVIYGPDQRTRLQPASRGAVYTVYAPPGIGSQAVHRHLEELRDYVQAAFPLARVEELRVYGG